MAGALRPGGLAHVRGGVDLASAAFTHLAARIHELHRAIADIPYRHLALVPGVNAVSEVVRAVHGEVSDAVYATVRTGGQVAFRAMAAELRAADAFVAPRVDTAPTPIRDGVVGAISGLVGDYMARERNPLTPRLGFYHDGRRLPVDAGGVRAAFPAATSRIAVFVHGLSSTERSWRFFVNDADPESVPYGDRLHAELGFTPLYVRYNSGLHVSHNGRLLARELHRLLDAYPVPVEEVVLVGHSMGGLVARAACHAGARRPWTARVSNVVCLGSPHLGAPLEKAVHAGTAVMNAFAVSRPIATLLEARSLGIRDLRFGYVADADWRRRDPTAFFANHRTPVPRLAHARYRFVGATFRASLRDRLGHVFGDGLVRLPSATACALADADSAAFPGVNHLRLLNHPSVYRQLLAWLRPAS
jgi:pimeloyl-ACP methyl ester carboxylesterase